MTANHAHTPTATQIREDYAHLRYHFADGWSIGEERVQFDNWLTAELAAAEQRWAERAWVEGVLYAHERHNNHAGLSPSWKFDNPYRADQMEGDDEYSTEG